VCSRAICLGRRTELAKAFEWWHDQRKGNRLHHVTLTVRHAKGEDPRGLIRGLSAAWSALWQGRKGRELRARVGRHFYARAVEITYGNDNGWHPHLHAVFFSKGDPPAEAWEELGERWRQVVGQKLGASHTPSVARGIRVRAVATKRGRSEAADYFAKLGLELDPHTKEARGAGHWSPWQLAVLGSKGSASAEERMPKGRARALWVEYVKATKGARALTWSRGLKVAAGIGEVTDAELAQDEGPGCLIYTIPGAAWDAACRYDKRTPAIVAALVFEGTHVDLRLSRYFARWLTV
jgi:hypothetical protein